MANRYLITPECLVIKVFGWVGFLILVAAMPALADLTVVREVLITPKRGSLAANIGPVNQSPNIRLTQADVAVVAGPVPNAAGRPLEVSVRARFRLESQSEHKLLLTVGFPVSNSQYSSFAMDSFSVTGPSGPRTVFQRVTSYPAAMTHRLVSGPAGHPARLLPDVERAEKQGAVYLSGGQRPVLKGESIGSGDYKNLMVWAETFNPKETKTLTVDYVMKVPLQHSNWSRRRVEGGYKGIWPQEANNLPLSFLKTIPKGEYYFFDYYLVSGAAWQGPIGRERVTLVLSDTWQGHRLFCNLMSGLTKTTVASGKNSEPRAAYVYVLTEREPKENLYFALTKP